MSDHIKIGNIYISVVLAGLLAFVLYWLTLAPDLVWQDQGDYQVQAAQLTLRIPGDVVRVHPLYIIFAHYLGRITPWGYAYAANLTSAIFAALGIAGLFALMRVLTRGALLPAIISAGICALGHTYWFMATQAQTYSMSNAFTIWGLLFTILYCLHQQRSYLYLACFIFGLGISVHNMSQIAFVVLAGYLAYNLIKRKISAAALLCCILLWLAGAMFWVQTIALEYQAGGDLPGSLQSAIYGRWGKAVFNAGDMLHLALRSGQFLLLNFPTPLLLLALPGLIYSRQMTARPVAVILAAALILYILFAFRYNVPNQNHFFMPAYILLCVYIGLGWQYLSGYCPRAAALAALVLVLLMIPTYAGISYAAERVGFKWGSNFRHIPYRDLYNYYLEPWQQDQIGPRKMVTEILGVLPQDAVLVVDSTPISAFEYAIEIEGQRPDIILVDLNDFDWEKYPDRTVFSLLDSDLYRRGIGPAAVFVPFGEMAEGEVIYKVEQN